MAKLMMLPRKANNPPEAVILAGGLGTRLGNVVLDRPKPMAPIQSRLFLEYLVGRLISNGFGRIVICVSYMKETIMDYFAPKYGPLVAYSVEEEPLEQRENFEMRRVCLFGGLR